MKEIGTRLLLSSILLNTYTSQPSRVSIAGIGQGTRWRTRNHGGFLHNSSLAWRPMPTCPLSQEAGHQQPEGSQQLGHDSAQPSLGVHRSHLRTIPRYDTVLHKRRRSMDFNPHVAVLAFCIQLVGCVQGIRTGFNDSLDGWIDLQPYVNSTQAILWM